MERRHLESTGDKIFNAINNILMAITMLVVLYPILFVISASISDPLLVNSGKVVLFPKGITFEGYARVFQNNDILIGYRNTIFYTVAGVLINLFVTLTSAFALTRKNLPGRTIIVALFTFTMFFSGGMIPSFLLINKLGIYNTVWAILLPGAAAMMYIIIARTYMQSSIPESLQEAALIDGCSDIKVFIMIILPLSTPIITVLGLFYGVGHWNSYFNALIYLSDRNIFPLQVFLREILIQTQIDSQMLMSGANLETFDQQAKIAEMIKYAVIIVSTLPLLIVYPFVQKYFTQGMMIGAVKG